MGARNKTTNAEFIEGWMQNYQTIPIFELAAMFGYSSKTQGSRGSAVQARARMLRKKGVDLPQWEYRPGAPGYVREGKKEIKKLNAILNKYQAPQTSKRPPPPGIKADYDS
jgi:hypothetical protein